MDFPYDVQGKTHTGYLSDGSGGQKAPGVLVFHGGGGLGAQARQRADMLAKLGFVAFAPDLFGHPINGVEHAHVVCGELTQNWQDLRRRCQVAFDVLKAQPTVDESRFAAIGFCFGGQVAIEFARSGASLRAVVGFHSQLSTVRPDDSANILASVLVCLGDQDCFVSANDRELFMKNMTASNVDCQMLLSSGVHHSFTDRFAEASGVPGLKYDANADKRSWKAMLNLFAESFDTTTEVEE